MAIELMLLVKIYTILSGVGRSKIAVDNSSEDLIHINEDFSF
jgi:hypothetical protein